MKNDYDAFEFTTFIERFLKEHPEVVADQQRGWDIYWNPRKHETKALSFPRNRGRAK
jgi:hypothetical protein